MEERFSSGTWTELSTGSPALTDAVVAFDCRVIETKMVATHNVVFAGVVAVRLGRPGGALVYHERAYKTRSEFQKRCSAAGT
jgi:cob(II)yrinic acid a,c-diamide reductase